MGYVITNNLVDFCSDAYHDADPENCRKNYQFRSGQSYEFCWQLKKLTNTYEFFWVVGCLTSDKPFDFVSVPTLITVCINRLHRNLYHCQWGDCNNFCV